ncbi:hypothetical protein ACH5RR_019780 [Cinchona calisaya]|uniref:Succinate dehydrogenase assembly factor 4, mitochondrial n=1 Tax=Cinchona calisaya TaxID=153742 RepID=A0ABD2ZQB1_9GENT
MARRNSSRLFASIIHLSNPKPIIPRSEFCSDSASRLIHSSTQLSQTQQPQSHDQDHHPMKKHEESLKSEVEENKLMNETEKDNNVEDGDDAVNVNKETGEVGGPRGPEPTRYGDWERNGRCSDF